MDLYDGKTLKVMVDKEGKAIVPTRYIAEISIEGNTSPKQLEKYLALAWNRLHSYAMEKDLDMTFNLLSFKVKKA